MSWAADLFDDEEDRANRMFDIAESFFDLLGFDDAADNLRRYRSGVGGTRSYTAEEMERHPAYGDAIDHNRTQFESETFTGRTGDTKLNEMLRDLRDGETVSFQDHWDRNMNFTRPSTYFAFGRSGIRSNGDFTATRQGDRLMIRGDITNRLGTEKRETESFDFNPGQTGYREGYVLEHLGNAKPFEMDYRRRQSVEAEARYDPKGGITLLNTSWGALE